MPEEKKRKIKPKAYVTDADDVIFNFNGGICKIHNKRNGTCITSADLKNWGYEGVELKDARGNTVTGAELFQTFKDYENEGLYSALELLPDSELALELIKKLDYKIIILTARDEKFGKATELNLIFNNIHQYVDEVHFSSNKVEKLKELSKIYNIQMFVDDKASTIQAVHENCKIKKVVLVEKAHNLNIELDPEIIRVKDLMETIRYLKEVK